MKLVKEIDDDTVDVTSWRMGRKANKQFPSEQFKRIPEYLRKPFISNQKV